MSERPAQAMWTVAPGASGAETTTTEHGNAEPPPKCPVCSDLGKPAGHRAGGKLVLPQGRKAETGNGSRGRSESGPPKAQPRITSIEKTDPKPRERGKTERDSDQAKRQQRQQQPLQLQEQQPQLPWQQLVPAQNPEEIQGNEEVEMELTEPQQTTPLPVPAHEATPETYEQVVQEMQQNAEP
ncbi:RNA polymerase II degradation factor 1-like [Temnothorax curvispinosus]|uniref:RNA polymerase II degradation factor 1-like n=1 Tax=Temnothorax curvispinosus TaxID=300111 RepID=A0A6J1RBC1_9HYME|nr:RNA polymerase II degradation factor 1-like [Temnothorax curvispinosus]